ncbi:MAG: hypothetical protein ACJ8AS_04760 [Hyphomicrobiales bacterium]
MKRFMVATLLCAIMLDAFANPGSARRKYHPRFTAKDVTSETLLNMVSVWVVAYSACKADPKPTNDKCTQADQTATALKEQGWCVGETDQVVVGFRWHRC